MTSHLDGSAVVLCDVWGLPAPRVLKHLDVNLFNAVLQHRPAIMDYPLNRGMWLPVDQAKHLVYRALEAKRTPRPLCDHGKVPLPIVSYKCDITQLAVDAIINPANELMTHGAGLAKYIVEKAGSDIARFSREAIKSKFGGKLNVGDVVMTDSGRTACKLFIAHVVGPRYDTSRDCEKLLRLTVGNALEKVYQAGGRSIAIPAVSAGLYKYPLRDATRIITETAMAFLEEHTDMVVVLSSVDDEVYDSFNDALATNNCLQCWDSMCWDEVIATALDAAALEGCETLSICSPVYVENSIEKTAKRVVDALCEHSWQVDKKCGVSIVTTLKESAVYMSNVRGAKLANEVYISRFETPAIPMTWEEVGRYTGTNEFKVPYWPFCACDFKNGDKDDLINFRFQRAQKVTLARLVKYAYYMKSCDKCNWPVDRWRTWVHGKMLRRHYVCVAGVGGILDTIHERVVNNEVWNVKEGIDPREGRIAVMLAKLLPDFVPEMKVEGKQLYRKRYVSEAEIGVTPLSVCDVVTALKKRQIVGEYDMPTINLLNYFKVYWQYTGPDPCMTYSAHHCKNCTLFSVFLGQWATQCWLKTVAYAMALKDLRLAPAVIAPDDIDARLVYLDYEEYKGHDVSVPDMCWLLFNELTNVWALANVNYFFKTPIASFPELADFDLQMGFERMSILASQVWCDRLKSDLPVNGFLAELDALDDNEEGDENYEVLVKHAVDVIHDGCVSQFAYKPSACSKTRALFHELMCQIQGFHDWEVFKKIFFIDYYAGFNVPENLVDAKFEAGDWDKALEFVLTVYYKGKFDSNKSASYYLPQYGCGHCILLDNVQLRIPHFWRFPVAGSMEEVPMIYCHDPKCRKELQKALLVSLAGAGVALNYAVPLVERDFRRQAYYGTLCGVYAQPSPRADEMIVVQWKVLEQLEERNTGITFDVMDKNPDAIYASHQYFRKRPQALRDDMELYDSCEDPSMSVAVFVSSFMYVVMHTFEELTRIRKTFPQASYVNVPPAERIVKANDTSAGIVLGEFGNSGKVREFLGTEFRHALVTHAGHSMVKNVFNAVGKIALGCKVKGRTISSTGALTSDIGAVPYGSYKALMSAFHGRKCEGPLFFGGNWHLHHQYSMSLPIEREHKLMQTYDATKFDKTLSPELMFLEMAVTAANIEPRDDGIDTVGLLLTETAMNVFAHVIVSNELYQHANGTSSGIPHTKTTNTNITELRYVQAQFMALQSVNTFNERYNAMRNDFCKGFVFRPPSKWNRSKYAQFIREFDRFTEAEVFRYNCCGDDVSSHQDPYSSPSGDEFVYCYYLMTQQWLDTTRLYCSRECILPKDFCSQGTVLDDKGMMLPYPDPQRIFSSTALDVIHKNKEQHVLKLFNLAVLARPLRFCTWLADWAQNLAVRLLEVARAELEDVNSQLPDELILLPGLTQYIDPNQTFDELLTTERIDALYAYQPDTVHMFKVPLKTLQAMLCGRAEGVDREQVNCVPDSVAAPVKVINEARMKSCLYCYDSKTLRCFDCDDCIDIRVCDKHLRHHQRSHDHKRYGTHETVFACMKCGHSIFVELVIQGIDVVCRKCCKQKEASHTIMQLYDEAPEYDIGDRFVSALQHDDDGDLIVTDNLMEIAYGLAGKDMSYMIELFCYIAAAEESQNKKTEPFVAKTVDGLVFSHDEVTHPPTISKSVRFTVHRAGKSLGLCEIMYDRRGKRVRWEGSVQHMLKVGDKFIAQRSPKAVALLRQYARQVPYMPVLRDLYMGQPKHIAHDYLEHVLPKARTSDERVDLLRTLMSQTVSFVEGPPGTGKTYLSMQLIDIALKLGLKVLFLAPSHSAVDEPCKKAHALYPDRVFRNIPIMSTYRVSCPEVMSPRLHGLAFAKTVSKVLFCTVQSHSEMTDVDLVLLDEAGLAQDADVAAHLARVNPKQVIVLGDAKQLPPVYKSPLVRLTSNMGNYFAFRTFRGYEDTALVKRLKVQFRMHPIICKFVSDNYYGGTLTTQAKYRTKYDLRDEDRIVVINCRGQAQTTSGGTVNYEEAKLARELVELIRTRRPEATVRAICSYNGTRTAIDSDFSSTIDAAQGDEFDFVIVCPSMTSTFTQNPNRCNVAFSRAKEMLIILRPNQRWGENLIGMPEPTDRDYLLMLLSGPDLYIGPSLKQESGGSERFAESFNAILAGIAPANQALNTDSNFLDFRRLAKEAQLYDLLVRDVQELESTMTGDIVAVDFEGVTPKDPQLRRYQVPGQLGYSFVGQGIYAKSFYIKPGLYRSGGNHEWVPIASSIPLKRKEAGGKPTPLYSGNLHSKMQKSRNDLLDVLYMFTDFLAKQVKRTPAILIWGGQMEIEVFQPIIEIDPDALCIMCGSREVCFRDRVGFKCAACQKDGYCLRLVNPRFYDLQTFIKQNNKCAELGWARLEAFHGDVCKRGGCIDVYHDAQNDAEALLCAFFSHVRPQFKPQSGYGVHQPGRHNDNLAVRQVQTVAMEAFCDLLNINSVMDIGFGLGRQKYPSGIEVHAIEPQPTAETYAKSSRLGSFQAAGLEDAIIVTKDAVAFNSLHHVEPACVKFENMLVTVYLPEDLLPNMKYLPLSDGDNRYMFLGTNMLYVTDHYSLEHWRERFPAYDISVFDGHDHRCAGDSVMEVSSNVYMDYPCIMQYMYGNTTMSLGKSACMAARSRYHFMAFKLNEMRFRIGVLWFRLKKNEVISEALLGRVWQYEVTPNSADMIDLPGYESRHVRSAPPGVHRNAGYSKIVQVIHTLASLGWRFGRTAILIGGAVSRTGVCPMGRALADMGFQMIASYDPRHRFEPSQNWIPANFDARAERAAVIISDVYMGYDPAGWHRYARELLEYVAYKKPGVLLQKVTVSCSAWKELCEIFSYYKTFEIISSAVTGMSSEMWLCGTNYNAAERTVRPLRDVFMNAQLQLAKEEKSPVYLTPKQCRYLSSGKLRHAGTLVDETGRTL